MPLISQLFTIWTKANEKARARTHFCTNETKKPNQNASVCMCQWQRKHNKMPMKIKRQTILTMVQPLLLDCGQEFKHWTASNERNAKRCTQSRYMQRIENSQWCVNTRQENKMEWYANDSDFVAFPRIWAQLWKFTWKYGDHRTKCHQYHRSSHWKPLFSSPIAFHGLFGVR